MTRKEALEALLAKIEAGECIFPNDFPDGFRKAPRAIAAFEGSLDAAMALHEAVLPGWNYSAFDELEGFRAQVEKPIGISEKSAVSFESPARAWLMAILKALIAEEKG